MVCVAPTAGSFTQGLKSYAFGVQKFKNYVRLDSIIQSDHGTLDMEHKSASLQEMGVSSLLRCMAGEGHRLR